MKRGKYHKWEEVERLYGKMKDRSYPHRINFLLTKIYQKQLAFHYIYEEGFYGVYLPTNELRAILGEKRVHIVLDMLVRDGILVPIDKRSRYGNKLHIFEAIDVAPSEYNSELPQYDYKFMRSVTLYYERKKKHLSPEANMQLINLRLVWFDISYEKFMESVKDNYPHYVSDSKSRVKNPSTLEEYIASNQLLWNRMVDFQNASGNGIYDFIHEDGFGNRIHTIVTQIPRHLKEKGIIKFRRTPTKEIDLHQSQPTILAQLLNEEKPNNDFSSTMEREEDIYLHLKDKYDLPSRNAAKGSMFHMLFGHPHGKAQKKFNAMFPEAGEIITRIKKVRNSDNTSLKIHSNLAMLLQRKESEMFREVARELNKERIRFVTVHDSVIVEDFHFARSREIVQSVLSNHLTSFKLK